MRCSQANFQYISENIIILVDISVFWYGQVSNNYDPILQDSLTGTGWAYQWSNSADKGYINYKKKQYRNW